MSINYYNVTCLIWHPGIIRHPALINPHIFMVPKKAYPCRKSGVFRHSAKYDTLLHQKKNSGLPVCLRLGKFHCIYHIYGSTASLIRIMSISHAFHLKLCNKILLADEKSLAMITILKIKTVRGTKFKFSKQIQNLAFCNAQLSWESTILIKSYLWDPKNRSQTLVKLKIQNKAFFFHVEFHKIML